MFTSPTPRTPSNLILSRRTGTPHGAPPQSQQTQVDVGVDSTNVLALLQRAYDYKKLYDQTMLEIAELAQPNRGFWNGMGLGSEDMTSIIATLKTDDDVDNTLRDITESPAESIQEKCSDQIRFLDRALGDASELVRNVDSVEAFDRFFDFETSNDNKKKVVRRVKEMTQQLMLPSRVLEEVRVIRQFARSYGVPDQRSWTEHRLVACLKKLPERDYVRALGFEGYDVDRLGRDFSNDERKREEIRAVLLALQRLKFRRTVVCQDNMNAFGNRPGFFINRNDFFKDNGMIYHNKQFKPECFCFLVAIYLGLEIPATYSSFQLLKQNDPGFVVISAMEQPNHIQNMV